MRYTHIQNVSGKEFRDNIVWVFNELKETVKQASNKIQKGMYRRIPKYIMSLIKNSETK